MTSDILYTSDNRQHEGGDHWDWAVSVVTADTTKNNYREDFALMDTHHPQAPEQSGVYWQLCLSVEWGMDLGYYMSS